MHNIVINNIGINKLNQIRLNYSVLSVEIFINVCKSQHVSCPQALLKHKLAKRVLENSDRYDNTALHVAAEHGYLGIVRVSNSIPDTFSL